MTHFIIYLLSLYQLSAFATSEFLGNPLLTLNSVDSDEKGAADEAAVVPIGKLNPEEEAVLDFDEPISSVNIDYLRNAIVLQFRKQRQKEMDVKRRQDSFNKNFMRFGRPDKSFMRFGKRQLETYKDEESLGSDKSGERIERSNSGARDSRGDNFMRFGRDPSNFMRFGREPSNFMRFGRSPGDFMRFGRSPGDFMRFGRQPTNNQNFMRFGKGHIDSNFMRFGRPDSFMRFGRSDKNNFMRFGKSADQSFMRFGKSLHEPSLLQANNKTESIDLKKLNDSAELETNEIPDRQFLDLLNDGNLGY